MKASSEDEIPWRCCRATGEFFWTTTTLTMTLGATTRVKVMTKGVGVTEEAVETGDESSRPTTKTGSGTLEET
jgi:hypothetical protein